VRAADARAVALVGAVGDAATMTAVTAERAFLARLGAGCMAPTGAHAALRDGALVLEAFVGGADGTVVRDALAGDAHAPEALGRALADRLLAAAPPSCSAPRARARASRPTSRADGVRSACGDGVAARAPSHPTAAQSSVCGSSGSRRRRTREATASIAAGARLQVVLAHVDGQHRAAAEAGDPALVAAVQRRPVREVGVLLQRAAAARDALDDHLERRVR
jgi:hypothetical protein